MKGGKLGGGCLRLGESRFYGGLLLGMMAYYRLVYLCMSLYICVYLRISAYIRVTVNTSICIYP